MLAPSGRRRRACGSGWHPCCACGRPACRYGPRLSQLGRWPITKDSPRSRKFFSHRSQAVAEFPIVMLAARGQGSIRRRIGPRSGWIHARRDLGHGRRRLAPLAQRAAAFRGGDRSGRRRSRGSLEACIRQQPMGCSWQRWQIAAVRWGVRDGIGRGLGCPGSKSATTRTAGDCWALPLWTDARKGFLGIRRIRSLLILDPDEPFVALCNWALVTSGRTVGCQVHLRMPVRRITTRGLGASRAGEWANANSW